VIVRGDLRDTVALSDADLEDAMRAVDVAIEASTGALPKATPKVQRRRVGCEYSQVHLEPAARDDTEREQVYFQRDEDHEQGMSLFPTMVGIATPSETAYVDAEVRVSRSTPGDVDMGGVEQAVAFPVVVRGPLVLRSVSGGEGDDEPLVVAPAAYDVVARFIPTKAPHASAAAGLRVFTLAISFHRGGTLPKGPASLFSSK
jgi:hypothetical protein